MHTLLLLLWPPSFAAEVVVFGDSWAEGGGDELADALRAAQFTYAVHDVGVSGTTATYWNSVAPTALADAVTLNPDARWVWLSILGNDTFGAHAAWQGPTSAATNEAQLRQLLDSLHAVHPDVQVVGFPYDYVNFEQSVECVLGGALYFPDLVSAGTFSSYTINRIFEAEVGEVLARVDADDVRYSTYPMWGTLQRDAGTVGAPNVLLPSPASRMADCIHPTSHGYRVIMDELVAAYWGHATPVAAIVGAPAGPVCEGASVSWSSASSHADAVEWTIDAAATSTDAAWTWTASPLGLHPVRLRAYGGAWHDDALASVEVVARPTIAVSPDVAICAGASTAVHAVGGSAASWSPVDGLDTPDAWDSIASPRETTTYTATVSSAVDCDASATVTVTVLELPAASIVGPERVQVGEASSFVATIDGASDVVWAADGGADVRANGASATVTWPSSGAYAVRATGTGENGCPATATWAVTVAPVDPVDTDSEAPSADSDTADAAPGCGCDTGTPSGAALVALGALLTWRRRRR